jgi:tripartite-type tricarboxylate transporter receptor subunit TctC
MPKQNPEKTKAANTGALGADFMRRMLIEQHATEAKFTQIPFAGGAQALQATSPEHEDVWWDLLYAMAQGASFARWPSPPTSVTSSRKVPTFKT